MAEPAAAQPLPSLTIVEDPRIARSRQAVIDAAIDLLVEEGPKAVTVDAVVARSKVAKSTLYRHWPSRDDLLLDVFARCGPEIADPDPDAPLAEALRALLRELAASATDPATRRLIPSLLTLKHELQRHVAVEDHVELRQLVVVGELLARGVEEGLVRPGYDVRTACAHLLGPLLFAVLTSVATIDEAFIDSTVEQFLAYYGTGRGETSS